VITGAPSFISEPWRMGMGTSVGKCGRGRCARPCWLWLIRGQPAASNGVDEGLVRKESAGRTGRLRAVVDTYDP
jgi:hypothetical protein